MHPVGMGAPAPGPIPWRDVMAWADREGHGEEQAALLDTVVQALDAIWLEHDAKQRAEQVKRENARHGHPAHRRG